MENALLDVQYAVHFLNALNVTKAIITWEADVIKLIVPTV